MKEHPDFFHQHQNWEAAILGNEIFEKIRQIIDIIFM
jgi:hypothetical protein